MIYITYNNYPYQLYFDTGIFYILQVYFVLYRYILYFVTGILHGYKVPAVMSTYHVPSTYNIDIRDCADGGLDFTSPRSDVFVLNSQIQNNYGTGVNILGMSSSIYNNNNNIRSIPDQFPKGANHSLSAEKLSRICRALPHFSWQGSMS